MQTAAIVLGIAALGGVAIAAMRLGGTPRPPTWLAVIHGLIAATGVVLFIDAAATTGVPPDAQYAIGVFVLAALGGLVMFFGCHMKEQPLPIPFVVGHGLFAACGYVLLLVALFGSA